MSDKEMQKKDAYWREEHRNNYLQSLNDHQQQENSLSVNSPENLYFNEENENERPT
ncbi:MAG TPA: hypothetical protein VIH27_03360 [Nitrososphaerales archaeon]